MGGDVVGALQRLAFAACFDAEHLACPGGVAQRLSDMQLARVPPRRCRVRAVVERVEVAYAWGTLYRRAFRDVDEHETVHALAFEAIGSPRLPRQSKRNGAAREGGRGRGAPLHGHTAAQRDRLRRQRSGGRGHAARVARVARAEACEKSLGES